MSRRLADVRLAVMMIDGIELGERTNVVALGITTEGVMVIRTRWSARRAVRYLCRPPPRRRIHRV